MFSRGGGHEVIGDFGRGADSLLLNAALFGQSPSAASLVDRYAEDLPEGVLLDFGGGDTLLLRAWHDLPGLQHAIDVF